ncbi:MAG: ABC transporter ATP-binding protein/permease [Bdellovibrionaceae bacterium]|nr:ABC transporter ATP-binding protein/permease [Pseudobdellovibrionaceae bacterium]NUM57630.1 ABC transporter ATP-binding protein [Pseudobdellovibrionaceae bacterium]
MYKTLVRILQEIKPYKKKLIVIAATGVLYAVVYARLALILKDINDSFQSGNQDKVGEIGLIAISMALIVAVTRYLHIFTMNYVAELITNAYRLKLQKKFMELNLSFHGQYSSGSGGLLSRIINDIKVIQDGLRMVADLFREPLLAVLLMGNLFYLNWKLTSFILVLLPLVLGFLRQISKSLRKYVIFGQENLEKITSIIKESVDGVRIIQSFNLENVMSRKLTEQTNEYLDIRKKVHSRIEIMGPVTELIATALILSIFFYFSVEVAKGNTTTGSVLAYITSLMMINQPIKKLQESYVRIQETIVAADRVFEILDNQQTVPEVKSPIDFPVHWQKISYKNVSFKYGSEWILKNISFEIKRGQSVAFVGQSGSGKSTIVNLLERFYDPIEGEILVDGINLQSFKLKELRQNIALVSQDVFLFSDSIENNIQSGDFSKDKSLVIEKAKHANAHEFILKTKGGYQSQVGDRGALLSGGEKQRISLARAFFKNASILILDEATSALDATSENEVQKGIDELMKGRTSIIVAHRLSTIQNCDRIFVLQKGQIVEQGNFDELVSDRNSIFSGFYNLQS